MPTLADFDPRPATMLWLNKNRGESANPKKCTNKNGLQTFSNQIILKVIPKNIKESKSLFDFVDCCACRSFC